VLTRCLPVLLVLASLLTACAGLGEPKPGAPAHHLERGFRNLNPAYRRPPLGVRIPFLLRRGWETTFRPRTADLPRVENDGQALRANRSTPTITWISRVRPGPGRRERAAPRPGG
jgi:hypothetical protein